MLARETDRPKTMMLKLQLKVPFAMALDAHACIPIFHTWIREAKVPNEVLIDVADYMHMTEGPFSLLVGHYRDIAFDVDSFGRGLQVVCKRDIEGDTRTQVRGLFDHMRTVSALLAEALQTIPAKLIAPDRARLRLNDRLLGSDPEACAALETAVREVASAGTSLEVERSDPRRIPTWLLSHATSVLA